MEFGYPKNARYKLWERKTKALLNLGQHTEMQNSLNDFLTAMDVADLSQDLKKKSVLSVHKLIETTMKQHKEKGFKSEKVKHRTNRSKISFVYNSSQIVDKARSCESIANASKSSQLKSKDSGICKKRENRI